MVATYRFTSAFATLALTMALQAAPDNPIDGERLFTLKVGPLLSEKCDGCHGGDPEKIKGELETTSLQKLLKGGESITDVLVPGDAKKSFILTSVRWDDEDYEMPPKENDRLTAEQIRDLEDWINAGAPWPDEEKQSAILLAESKKAVTDEGVIIQTSGGLGDDWTFRRYKPEDVWAFQPVVRPEVPKVEPQIAESRLLNDEGKAALGASFDNQKSSLSNRDSKASANPIDAFIAEKLTEVQVEPAPPADARTLIRRITFDLIGLPPTPEEVAAFEAEHSRDPQTAIDQLTTRLLASPHYGERWAQHWLDVARYADTGGMSNDYERSNAWRYRDYVIRAFNNDKPYDQFVMEQIAGDELAANPEQGTKNSELLIATGFLRMGPWDPAMVKNEEARQLYLDDVVNSVGQTFLATTMRCFKCHDHKFDPLPTRDYYRMYATFAGTQIAERPADFLPDENLDGFDEGRAHVQRLLGFAEAEVAKLVNKRETAAKKWYAENNLPYKDEEARKDDPDEMKPIRHVGLSIEEQGQLKVREQDVWIWTRRLERYEPMVQSVYNGPDPKFLNARKLRMPGKIPASWKPESHILTGGSLEAPGEKVGPGILSALGIEVGASEIDPYVIADELGGRRLALAQWIAHPDNPLTTRSIVNRIWQQHFGKPIAGNPNNFGVKGAKPTHPKLLDWLSADFVEHGWKIKRLHQMIISSKTYQQSTRHPDAEKLLNDDPNNDLFAHFPIRRLTAEEIRDSMLAITGELNPKLGGLPIMPEMNMEVALQPRMIQFSLAPAYQPSPKPEQRNRRSIYVYRVRGQADPFLEVLNQPITTDSCEMRDSASVSPQAFTLMNSDLMTDRSIAFALRLEKETQDLNAQVARAFDLCLGRAPTDSEQQKLAAYVTQMRSYHQTKTPKPVSYPTQVTRSLVEEFSGQPFEYEEILPAFEHYQPDTKASDVGPSTRALADLCLALFNSHEFVHVY